MRRWFMVGLISLAGACDDSTPKGPPVTVEPEAPEPEAMQPADQRDFLLSFHQDLVAPTYAAVQQAARDLTAATTAWAAAPGDADARDAARAAWARAMDQWQRGEVLQIGPASAAGAGAEKIRDALYSWPSTNACRIDQEVARDAFEGEDLAATRLVNAYGLDALEYVLYAGPGNDCPPQAPPNSDGRWAELGEAGVEANRARYAHALALQFARDADRLATAWTTFGPDLVAAGDGSTHFASRRDAYNAIFSALFYLDLYSKDAKIGDVAGITAGCAETACPDNAESRYAGRDAANLLANLKAAEGILFGAPGVDGATGFTALVDARGAESLTAALRAALDNAVAVVGAIDAPFSRLATEDPARLQAAYDAVKALTDLLKTQFVTTLNLNVPSEGASDND